MMVRQSWILVTRMVGHVIVATAFVTIYAGCIHGTKSENSINLLQGRQCGVRKRVGQYKMIARIFKGPNFLLDANIGRLLSDRLEPSLLLFFSLLFRWARQRVSLPARSRCLLICHGRLIFLGLKSFCWESSWPVPDLSNLSSSCPCSKRPCTVCRRIETRRSTSLRKIHAPRMTESTRSSTSATRS